MHMLHVILISLFVGALIGVAAFYFGHGYATKYWGEFISTLQKDKSRLEDELARMKQRL
jgi:hypothetical protein